jgi:hypothetical protein
LAAAVEAVLKGIVAPGRRGPHRGAASASVESLERRVMFDGNPAWLAAGSAATWDAASKSLTVTGAASIVADPGADEPNIVASGPGAHLTIAPAVVPSDVHLGGITLANGAAITVPAQKTGTFLNFLARSAFDG